MRQSALSMQNPSAIDVIAIHRSLLLKEEAVVKRSNRADVYSAVAQASGQAFRVITIAVLLAFGQLAISTSAWAKDETRDTASEAGLGVASVLVSIPYGVAKVTYAVAGALTGGFAYVFTGGNLKAAQSVWDTSLRGTYIITPDHLRGEKPIRFLGVPPEAEAQASASSKVPDTSAPTTSMVPSDQGPAMQSGPSAPTIMTP